jgi:plasmid stability protein
MGNLLIRDVEDAIVQRLKVKARINRTSLQHEASKALGKGTVLTGAERKAIFDRIEAERGFPKVATGGAEMIRAIRDGDEDEDEA